MTRRARGAWTLAALASVVACRPDAHFAVNFASDFKPPSHRVSVFGVYKDGQMSSGGWTDLRPSIERALGGGTCEVAYGGVLAPNAALSATIDDYTRASGPTDALMIQLAPAARGDLIMVLTEAGKLPVRAHSSLVDPPQPGGGQATRTRKTTDPNVLQLSASFFSVAEGRSVARVDMQYFGDRVDAAIDQFATKLSDALPGGACRGWSGTANVDLIRMQKLTDE